MNIVKTGLTRSKNCKKAIATYTFRKQYEKYLDI